MHDGYGMALQILLLNPLFLAKKCFQKGNFRTTAAWSIDYASKLPIQSNFLKLPFNVLVKEQEKSKLGGCWDGLHTGLTCRRPGFVILFKLCCVSRN